MVGRNEVATWNRCRNMAWVLGGWRLGSGLGRGDWRCDLALVSRQGQGSEVSKRTTCTVSANDLGVVAHDLRSNAQPVRAVLAHCALDPVLGLGHYFGSLFMDIIH